MIEHIFQNLSLDIFGIKSSRSSDEDTENEERREIIATAQVTQAVTEAKIEAENTDLFVDDGETTRTVEDEFSAVLKETQDNDRDIRSLMKLCTSWVKTQEKFSASLKSISIEALGLLMKETCVSQYNVFLNLCFREQQQGHGQALYRQ